MDPRQLFELQAALSDTLLALAKNGSEIRAMGPRFAYWYIQAEVAMGELIGLLGCEIKACDACG